MKQLYFVAAICALPLGACGMEIQSSKDVEATMPADKSPFMPGIVSTEANEYNLSQSDDGSLMIFARSEKDFGGSRIMTMKKQGAGWSEPTLISFGDKPYRDSDPWLTRDGQWLYFVSARAAPDRANGRTDRDVWRVRRATDGGWQQPEHLAAVSSTAEELGPELHGDTLYFNSSRPGGAGKLDIYAASVHGDGGFEDPVALGSPINSTSSEGDFTLSRDGKRAYFWSSRDAVGTLYTSHLTEEGKWGTPVRLPSPINDGSFAFTPSLGKDGRMLFYASTRIRTGQAEGIADVYLAQLP